MPHDSVPREITGLDQWECLGRGRGNQWWRGKCGSHLGEWWYFTVAPWSMAVSPAGESGTIDGFWHPGTCSNSELCAMAKQLSLLQTASLLWAHPSLSRRPSSISQRRMKKSPRLYMLLILPSPFCPDLLWFMYYYTSPLNYSAKGLWHHPALKLYVKHAWENLLKGLNRQGICSNQRMTECALACPGIGISSLPL